MNFLILLLVIIFAPQLRKVGGILLEMLGFAVILIAVLLLIGTL